MRRSIWMGIAALAVSTAACSSGASSSGSIPATRPFPTVEHATDLSVEPVIGPGAAPAPTALKVKDLVVGTGKTATKSTTVTVQYVGTHYPTGKVFDASWRDAAYQQTDPKGITFALTGVVPGFALGIEGMKVGGRREMVIPPALGYGTQGSPPVIQPYETLVFVVDLTAVS